MSVFNHRMSRPTMQLVDALDILENKIVSIDALRCIYDYKCDDMRMGSAIVNAG